MFFLNFRYSIGQATRVPPADGGPGRRPGAGQSSSQKWHPTCQMIIIRAEADGGAGPRTRPAGDSPRPLRLGADRVCCGRATEARHSARPGGGSARPPLGCGRGASYGGGECGCSGRERALGSEIWGEEQGARGGGEDSEKSAGAEAGGDWGRPGGGARGILRTEGVKEGAGTRMAGPRHPAAHPRGGLPVPATRQFAPQLPSPRPSKTKQPPQPSNPNP